MHDVAVPDNVLLPLEAQRPLRLRLGHRAAPEELLATDHLGADESLFEIGMDSAGGRHGVRAAAYVPRADLVFPDRHEADVVHGIERAADELVPRAPGDPHLLEEVGLLRR